MNTLNPYKGLLHIRQKMKMYFSEEPGKQLIY